MCNLSDVDNGRMVAWRQEFCFYAPNFEKVGSILLSACPFVCPFVRPFKKFKARFLKFHIWIPHQK